MRGAVPPLPRSITVYTGTFYPCLDSRFFQQCCWRSQPSGVLRCVDFQIDHLRTFRCIFLPWGAGSADQDGMNIYLHVCFVCSSSVMPSLALNPGTDFLTASRKYLKIVSDAVAWLGPPCATFCYSQSNMNKPIEFCRPKWKCPNC
jgi:hypothetical protein